MTTHQGRAGAEDPGWETSVQGARCQQRAEDSKGKRGRGRKEEKGPAEPYTSCVLKQPHPLSTKHPQEPP